MKTLFFILTIMGTCLAANKDDYPNVAWKGKPDFYMCAGWIAGYHSIKNSCPESHAKACPALLDGSYIPDDIPRCMEFYPQLKNIE